MSQFASDFFPRDYPLIIISMWRQRQQGKIQCKNTRILSLLQPCPCTPSAHSSLLAQVQPLPNDFRDGVAGGEPSYYSRRIRPRHPRRLTYVVLEGWTSFPLHPSMLEYASSMTSIGSRTSRSVLNGSDQLVMLHYPISFEFEAIYSS